MALKFLYITQDPFTNNSQEFVRVLAISNGPSFPSGGGVVNVGVLYDSSGNIVGSFNFLASSEATEATAYPYAFSAGWSSVAIIIVPPMWSFKSFGRAIAIQGSLEEVLRVS